MYKGFKIVCVTPAGRARYMKILLPYILSSPSVDEYHIWVNTTNEHDLRFLKVCEENFSKVKLIHLEGQKPNWVRTINHFFPTATDSDTIYIRFDDDIVFIEDGFFEAFLDFRMNNPHYFLVSPMIMNNAICTFIQKTLGKINISRYHITANCMDPITWASPAFAESLHALFLHLLEQGNIDHLKFDKREIALNRFSINCISWFGSELKKFNGIVPLVDEEEWLSLIKPLELGMSNCIYGEKIVSHFAFYKQRTYLDRTPLLERYSQLCQSKYPSFWDGIPI